MSRRDWRYYAALGGLVAVIAGGALAQKVDNGPPAQQAANHPAANASNQPTAAQLGVSAGNAVAETHKAQPEGKKGVELGSWPDWVIVAFTLVLTIVAVLQHRLEARMGRETADALAIAKQSADAATAGAEAMARVAVQVERSAIAAQESVDALRERTAQQMRAYVCTLVAGGTYQERDRDLRFEALPRIINVGSTPAYDVWYSIDIGVLPVPLPENHKFKLGPMKRATYLPPGQDFFMSAILPDYVPDGDVGAIRAANTVAIYVWGAAWYRDQFKVRHRLTFCHQMIYTDSGVRGLYTGKHNRSS